MCAIQYTGIDLEVAGSPAPDVTGTYVWAGHTTDAGEDFDYWTNVGNGFTVWYLPAAERYIIADTYPAAPGAGDDWWQADKPDPVSPYYLQGTATANCHTYPLEAATTPWHSLGHEEDWLVRSDATKEMHGQAFYPRSTFPPKYADLEFYPDPDPGPALPPIDEWKTCYDTSHMFATLYLHFTAAFQGDVYNGLSIFQIYPRSRTKAWERKHTRLISRYDELEVVLPGWADYPFDLTVSYPTIQHLRIFARIWNRLAFMNLGPMTAQEY